MKSFEKKKINFIEFTFCLIFPRNAQGTGLIKKIKRNKIINGTIQEIQNKKIKKLHR